MQEIMWKRRQQTMIKDIKCVRCTRCFLLLPLATGWIGNIVVIPGMCFSELFLLFVSSSFHLLLVIRAKPYNYVLVFRLQIILKSIISLYTQKRPVRQVGRDYPNVKIVLDGWSPWPTSLCTGLVRERHPGADGHMKGPGVWGGWATLSLYNSSFY